MAQSQEQGKAYRAKHAERRAAYSKQWRKDNPEKAYVTHRKAGLKWKYGVTIEYYEAVLARQGGGCAFCGKTPEENGQVLCFDHDHGCCPGVRSCGKCLRWLLCTHCNQGLGKLQDSVEVLETALTLMLAWQQGTDPWA